MVSFYSFLDRVPRGRFRIRLSKTPISFMKGAKDVARAFEEALGVSIGETSADGAFTLEWDERHWYGGIRSRRLWSTAWF